MTEEVKQNKKKNIAPIVKPIGKTYKELSSTVEIMISLRNQYPLADIPVFDFVRKAKNARHLAYRRLKTLDELNEKLKAEGKEVSPLNMNKEQLALIGDILTAEYQIKYYHFALFDGIATYLTTLYVPEEDEASKED